MRIQQDFSLKLIFKYLMLSRKAANRDACLPCIKLKKSSGSQKSAKSWSSKIFDGGILRWFFGSKFAPFLLKGPNKVIKIVS